MQGVQGMRIIAGELRGRRLHRLEGKQTRPTSDRLREAIFSILSSRTRQAVVLDLFSGTGAMAIEALSRGADSALLVDDSSQAISLITRNIRSLGLENKARVQRWNITHNLNLLRNISPQFSLVFMDPPYNRNMIDSTLYHLLQSSSLMVQASIVIEHSVMDAVSFDYPQLNLDDQRTYGKTRVSFLSYNPSGDDSHDPA
jgi:16S rRNA (guanine966-N2)-methyltransferase